MSHKIHLTDKLCADIIYSNYGSVMSLCHVMLLASPEFSWQC